MPDSFPEYLSKMNDAMSSIAALPLDFFSRTYITNNPTLSSYMVEDSVSLTISEILIQLQSKQMHIKVQDS